MLEKENQITWQVLQANDCPSDNKKRKLILQVFWEFRFIHICCLGIRWKSLFSEKL